MSWANLSGVNTSQSRVAKMEAENKGGGNSMGKSKKTKSPKTEPNTTNQACPQIKKFAFISDAAEREYKNLPQDIQRQFGVSLRAVQKNEKPLLQTKNLGNSVGAGAIELIINGSPANRCIYVAKFEGIVIVLHSFEKTTNGVDRQAMKTAKARYKEMKVLLAAMK